LSSNHGELCWHVTNLVLLVVVVLQAYMQRILCWHVG
jgi:hypothetical protein